jgi:hypothetical protein
MVTLSIILIVACKDLDPKVDVSKPITDINNVTAEQGYEVIYEMADDSCEISTTISKSKPPKPTNEGEKKADENKIEKIKDDLAKSKYSSCDEILKDYQNILNELRKGNRKPLKEFPIDTDPKIAICKGIDKSFAIKLDSLQKLSSKIIDDL